MNKVAGYFFFLFFLIRGLLVMYMFRFFFVLIDAMNNDYRIMEYHSITI